MNTLMYLVYGDRREYHAELTYSVASALAACGPEEREALRLVLVSDRASVRPDLPMESIVIDTGTLREWQLSGTYVHGAKIRALQHVAERTEAPVALCDTDTFFVGSPARLFERVSPGCAVMHANEGPLADSIVAAEWEALCERSGGAVGDYAINMGSSMYNSGALALHPDDLALLDDVDRVMRRIRELSRHFTAEQLASSLVLAQRGEVRCVDDLLIHYWAGPRRYFHYQIGRMYPARDRRAFEALATEPPTLELTPRVHLMDKLSARLQRASSRKDETYGWSLICYRSALRHKEHDEELAALWMAKAMDALRRGSVTLDERFMKRFPLLAPEHIDQLGWLPAGDRSAWRAHLEECGVGN